MAVYKKKDNWWIDYYYQGRRHREKIGTRKRDAEDALNQIRVQITTGTFLSAAERAKAEESKPKPISLTTFADEEFTPWSKGHHSDKSHLRLASMFQRHLKPAFGEQALSEITRKHIEDYMTKRLRSRYKRGNKTFPTSEATINRELCGLKVMLRKAVEWGFLEVSPAHGIRAFKEKNAVPQLLEADEVARFLEELRSDLSRNTR
jgi:hypothetical protein